MNDVKSHGNDLDGYGSSTGYQAMSQVNNTELAFCYRMKCTVNTHICPTTGKLTSELACMLFPSGRLLMGSKSYFAYCLFVYKTGILKGPK